MEYRINHRLELEYCVLKFWFDTCIVQYVCVHGQEIARVEKLWTFFSAMWVILLVINCSLPEFDAETGLE